MQVIEAALRTASKAHEGQYRKNTNIPYITHPVAVGIILMKEGYDDQVVAAGILHDTVEDTDLDLQDIEAEFGPRIAEIVKGCSEPDKSLPWEVRKKYTIQFLKTASMDIRAVACADKLHNVRTMINDFQQMGDKVWDKFKRGRKQQEWYYTNVVASLGAQSDFPMLKELEREVTRLFTG